MRFPDACSAKRCAAIRDRSLVTTIPGLQRTTSASLRCARETIGYRLPAAAATDCEV